MCSYVELAKSKYGIDMSSPEDKNKVSTTRENI